MQNNENFPNNEDLQNNLSQELYNSPYRPFYGAYSTRFVHFEVVYLDTKAQQLYDRYSIQVGKFHELNQKMNETDDELELIQLETKMDDLLSPAELTEAKESLFKDTNNLIIRKKTVLAEDILSYQEWVNGLTYLEFRNGDSNYVNMEYIKFQELMNSCIF